jgi:methyltransferase-like protein
MKKENNLTSQHLTNVNNINIDLHFLKYDYETAKVKLEEKQLTNKTELLQAFINDCLSSEGHMSLLYDYAVRINYGMDVDVYDSLNLFEYAIKYVLMMHHYDCSVVSYDVINWDLLH